MRSCWLCLRLLTESGPLKNATVEVFVRLNSELALEHEDLLIGARLRELAIELTNYRAKAGPNVIC
jgi:hypothetical protein